MASTLPIPYLPVPDRMTAFASASDKLALDGSVDSRGAIYTRREVVDFILDLSGYTEDRPLHTQRILEPSFGGGDFLLPIIKRLLQSWKAHRPTGLPLEDLAQAIIGVELHRATFMDTRKAVIEFLRKEGLKESDALGLTEQWLHQGDYLLLPFEGMFDFVIGNPPYVRQERIPPTLLTEYRNRYRTMYDRADLYIGFMERSLSVLKNGGTLGFICADRWMKNRYGGPLRNLITRNYHLKVYVDMVGTQAFHSEVSAYPAITIIRREASGPTRIASRPTIAPDSLAELADVLLGTTLPTTMADIHEVAKVAAGTEPWLLGSSDQTALIRRLEHCYPSIEQVGCKVGIGVATGADGVFIGRHDQLDVEPDRTLRLATTKDISSGEVEWTGSSVINPYSESGELVNLADYPRLRRYFESHRDGLLHRHVARKTPANWYRTIDRIIPALASTPKLLIPDIKGEAHVVFEDGTLYPHHNLYYVTSRDWDLRALQAVLLSAVAKLFVSTYSTRMRGGYLRFQAQYLRRIRVPFWTDVPMDLRATLIDAACRRDLDACNEATFALYNMSDEERLAAGERED